MSTFQHRYFGRKLRNNMPTLTPDAVVRIAITYADAVADKSHDKEQIKRLAVDGWKSEDEYVKAVKQERDEFPPNYEVKP